VRLYPIDRAQFEQATDVWRPPDDRERRAATRQPAQRTAEQVDRRPAKRRDRAQVQHHAALACVDRFDDPPLQRDHHPWVDLALEHDRRDLGHAGQRESHGYTPSRTRASGGAGG
jgi:hypothetical protein